MSMKTAVSGFITLCVYFVMSTLCLAQGNIPHTFTAGTKAKASEVNANFQALDSRMTALSAKFIVSGRFYAQLDGYPITFDMKTIPDYTPGLSVHIVVSGYKFNSQLGSPPSVFTPQIPVGVSYEVTGDDIMFEIWDVNGNNFTDGLTPPYDDAYIDYIIVGK